MVAYKAKTLTHGAEAFVASSATTVGDVTLGGRSSLWYGSSVRGAHCRLVARSLFVKRGLTLHAGDAGSVTIGSGSAILDNALVHGTRAAPAKLGSGVVVSPGAVVRSATIGDGAMIGMGAVVLPGATIGANAFIDAGAVVGAGATVAAGQLWTGSPARFLRTLTADEVKYLHAMAAELSTLALQHAAQGAKSVAEVEADEEVRLYRRERGFPAGAALPVTEEEVLEYYKLSTPGMPGSASLLRDHEFDEAAEAAARETAEAAADAEENAHYNHVARLRCVGESAVRKPWAPCVGTLVPGVSLAWDCAAHPLRPPCPAGAWARPSRSSGRRAQTGPPCATASSPTWDRSTPRQRRSCETSWRERGLRTWRDGQRWRQSSPPFSLPAPRGLWTLWASTPSHSLSPRPGPQRSPTRRPRSP